MPKKVCYTVFVEDKPYLLWQLELFLYSLTKRAGVAEKDIIVFWASPDFYSHTTQEWQPWMPSDWLRGILEAYPEMRHQYCQNFGRQNRSFRFMGNGNWHGEQYVPINKWSSLCEWANNNIFDEWDEVWVLEQDLWFSDKIPQVPDGNVVTYNWINHKTKAFRKEHNDEQNDDWMRARGFKKNGFRGQNLEDILKLTGTPKSKIAKWTQGAVLFKFRTKDFQKTKLLNDILNYSYLMIHLMEIKHPLGKRYETEMIGTGLALANNGIEMQQLRDDRFRTDIWTHDEEIPQGTIVHYGWDFKNYKHLNVEFGKHNYSDLAPWQGGVANLRKWRDEAKFEWTKNFFTDMLGIHADFPNILRSCHKTTNQQRV